MPARKADTLPVLANKCAVATNWSSVSALHGPAINKGSLPVLIQELNGCMFKFSFIFFLLVRKSVKSESPEE
jgi:hypothetical protein